MRGIAQAGHDGAYVGMGRNGRQQLFVVKPDILLLCPHRNRAQRGEVQAAAERRSLRCVIGNGNAVTLVKGQQRCLMPALRRNNVHERAYGTETRENGRIGRPGVAFVRQGKPEGLDHAGGDGLRAGHHERCTLSPVVT